MKLAPLTQFAAFQLWVEVFESQRQEAMVSSPNMLMTGDSVHKRKLECSLRDPNVLKPNRVDDVTLAEKPLKLEVAKCLENTC